MKINLTYVVLCLCVAVFPVHAKDGVSAKNARLLERLDSLIDNSAQFAHDKEARISSLRNSLAGASDPEKRYWLTTSLYDEYSAYDSDSALLYARRGLELAHDLHRQDLVNDQELNRVYVLTATGFMDEAYRSLMRLDRGTFSPDQLYKYCDRMLFLATHQSSDAEGREGLAAHELDSLVRQTIASMPAEAQSYCGLRGWETFKNPQQVDQAIAALKPKVDKSHFTTCEDALNAYVLSQLYDYKNDEDHRLRYLILSAMADARTCNKEIASLESVANILYEKGDLNRASKYINFAIACASRYKSQVRMPSLAEAQDRTMRAILDRNTRQGHHLFVLLLALAALLAVLAVAVMLLIRRTRSLKRSRRILHETNEKLSQHVQRLKSTGEELHATNLKLEASNEKLAEKYDDAVQNASDLVTSNSDKEKCIADIFALCSDYITKIEDFRTRIFRLMIAGKYDEARDIAKSGELSSRELKDLYANFDRLFLRIYPDFVSDLNTLLKPDSQIEQKQQGVLNTELRICALMRLGVSDSSKIAKFLHVSVQTVYNTSQRLRNKALIPRENFAETVRSLGQISL